MAHFHAHGDHDHDHGHDHDHRHGHAHGHAGLSGRRTEQRRRLRWVLAITALFMGAEVAGGIIADSLALLADAAHMFTDVAAIGLSLFAMHMARRPPSLEKTYGYVRMEILAALANGAVLLVLAGVIAWEAWQRLAAPVEVDALVLMVVAGMGLVVNIVGATLLHAHAQHSLNVRGAYLHVLGDLLGSVGALTAGGIILLTGWYPADSIVSVFIALLILVSAWRLLREATDVLLEAAPRHIDVGKVRAALEAVPELHDVHDLHVWTLTSGFVALSGHGVIDDPAHHARVLADIRTALADFGIEHVTFQIEPRTLYQIPRRQAGGGARARPRRGDEGGGGSFEGGGGARSEGGGAGG